MEMSYVTAPTATNSKIFNQRESNVRSYCRSFPVVFHRAKDAMLYSEEGKAYIDFLAGAGALNYGHNNDYLKHKIMDYLAADGLSQGLDMYTSAKRHFLEQFTELILEPRNLNYKVQFTGPTGANAVEAALKLARKVKQRTGIFSFMGGYHGLSLGGLSVTSNSTHRASAGIPLDRVTFIPYPEGPMADVDGIAYMQAVLEDTHSGIEKPAAIIVETVQAEGGIVVAPVEWLQRLRILCDTYDILLICDDIQTGCYRTGPFFSFERAGIVPDIVVLSKSISGYGLPMSLVLMKADLDLWQPAEHTGTFRGNQLAFVSAAAALEYSIQAEVEHQVRQKQATIERFLADHIRPLHCGIMTRGIGMIWGIDLAGVGDSQFVKTVARRCFDYGLLVERVGRADTVIKILPPLTIAPDVLEQGLTMIKTAIQDCLAGPATSPFAADTGTEIFEVHSGA